MRRLSGLASAGAGDPIHVWLKNDADLPEEFVWRGRRHRVRTVELLPGPPAGPGGRRFRVRTSSGLRLVLQQDSGFGSWRIDRMMTPGGIR